MSHPFYASNGQTHHYRHLSRMLPVFVSLKTIKEKKIELIHSHWIIPRGLVGALLQWVSGIPHITSIHGTDIHLVHSHRFIYPCLRFIANYSDCITANSSHTYRLVHDIVPSSVAVTQQALQKNYSANFGLLIYYKIPTFVICH